MTWGVWMSQGYSKEPPKRASYTLGEEKHSPHQENLPRVMPIRFYNASCWEHRILRLPAHLSQGGAYLSFSSPPTRTTQVLSSPECSSHGTRNGEKPGALLQDDRISGSSVALWVFSFLFWGVSTYPWISGLNPNLPSPQVGEYSGKEKNSLSICRLQAELSFGG